MLQHRSDFSVVVDGMVSQLKLRQPLSENTEVHILPAFKGGYIHSRVVRPKSKPPTGQNLLDEETREDLPELFGGEELGLDTPVLELFFTPEEY